MATFHPPAEHLDDLLVPLDADALDVVEALRTLDDGWTVYVHPRLGQDVADFIAVHDTEGVVVLDVWRDAGRAATSAARQRATIWNQFFSLPGDARDSGSMIRAAVVAPFVPSCEVVGVVGGTTNGWPRDVSIWGTETLAQCAVALTVPGATAPPTESIRRLHRQLVVDGVACPTLTPVQLSEDARRVAANPTHAAVRGVTGPPGSGKSFALAARAARLAAEGKSVLVLCFNLTLAQRLRGLVGQRCAEYGANPARVTCTSFHTLCARIVEDAAADGILAAEPARGTWPEKVVEKTADVLTRGFERRYDAVLVDEGQDFRLPWWNLLRQHVVSAGGEMLIVTDPSVDLYGTSSWTRPDTLAAAGFTEPFIEMTGSYRMGPALIDSTNLFARSFVDTDAMLPEVPSDQEAVVGSLADVVRTWRNIERVADLGAAVGDAVVQLLRDHPDLAPRDVVYLCEYHHDGLAAASRIEAAGHPVHHLYSRDPDERQRRKARFWPDDDAVKGGTVHAFKGWESPAVVLGIGVEERSRRLAYTAMTRVSSTGGVATSYLSVVNADPRMSAFRPTFELGTPTATRS